jgi:uncharacterized protein (TIGR03545 family)
MQNSSEKPVDKSSKKPPKPFRKPIKPKKYQKKLAGRIYLEPDRAFLASITATNDDGRIVLSRELTKEERGRLKKLRKAAKKNRGGLRMARFVILAVLVGAVVVFNLVFKDRLVTRGAESLLEGVFEAQADLHDVQFHIFSGEISFSSLTIADAKAPMQNLVELSAGVLRLDSWQLVNGHVLIEELTVDGLQFGTPREESGLLVASQADAQTPSDDQAAGDPGDDAGSGGLVDRITEALPPISFADLGLPDTLDAQLFLEQNLDALSTTVAVETLAGSATSFVDRWTGEVQSLTDELTGIVDDVQGFASTDFTSIASVDAAMSVYDDATAIQATVTGMTTRIESEYNALVAEATGILESARALPDLARADYEDLIARIPDVRAEGKDFIVGLVEPYLREALGDWYDRIMRGLEIYERLTAESVEREPRAGKRTGTDINFATTEYPRFLLSSATLGVGASDAEVLSTTISNLSTQPDLVDGPTLVNYRQGGRAGSLTVDASLDGRTGAENPFDLTVVTADSPLAISRGLEMLDLSSVTGVVALGGNLSRQLSGAFEGALDLSAARIAVEGTYEPNSLGGFIADLLNDAGLIEGAFAFTIASRSDVQFHSGQTNLDDLVADAVRELVESTIAAFREELNTRVTAYLDPIINSLTDKLAGIIDIETSAEELLALARDREAAAAELERFAEDSISALRNQLEAEARAMLDAAKAEAEARAQAVINAAEAEAARVAAEAEAQARAAADAAAAAAEEAARDAAGDAADTIRNALPIPRRR